MARYPQGFGSSHLCTGFEFGGADMCLGASGGPLMAVGSDGCPYQVGIVSWGEGCGEPKGYGVATRISSYLSWLREHVPDLNLAKVDEDKPTSLSSLPDDWRAMLGLASSVKQDAANSQGKN